MVVAMLYPINDPDQEFGPGFGERSGLDQHPPGITSTIEREQIEPDSASAALRPRGVEQGAWARFWEALRDAFTMPNG